MTKTRGKELRREIKTIMSEVFKVRRDRVPDNVSINDIEKWDSMNHTLLILALEEHFNTSFSLEEAVEATSLDAIVNIIGNHRNTV
jgi:acyl carrier protein